MNITNEVLELWEEEARRAAPQSTSAHAHVLHLIKEVREMTDLLAFQHARLFITDPEYRRMALAND